MGQQFAVEGGLEDGARLLEVVVDFLLVHDVAVTGDDEITAGVVEEQRLHVVETAAADVSVADGRHSDASLQLANGGRTEDAVNQSHTAMAVAFPVFIEGGHAGTFLSAVLKVMQSVIQGR